MMKRRDFISGTSRLTAAVTLLPAIKFSFSEPRFDPWLEINGSSLRQNVRKLSGLASGRKILAVVKNNGYGLGIDRVARLIEPLDEIMGFAAVKADACIQLRDSGIRKPILHMGLANDKDAEELMHRDIRLSLFDRNAASQVLKLTGKFQRKVKCHIYTDTGMSRMGVPYDQAISWMESMDFSKLEVEGTFMGFTEEPDFDREQLNRFKWLASEAKKKGFPVGQLHAASSNAVYHLPEAHLDFVRPGIGIYGAYPTYPDKEKRIQPLTCAFRLKAGVVRVEKLRTGDSVSYGRNYVAKEPVWIATLPVGHADGYTRKAVHGAKVRINGRLFPVIGAVSASHTIIEVGMQKFVEVGDIATLIGPDDPAIEPSSLSEVTGTSVYDVLMHLNPNLPKKET